MEKRIRRVRTQTQKHLDWYARDGLRTLCIAKKVILFFKKMVIIAIIMITTSVNGLF